MCMDRTIYRVEMKAFPSGNDNNLKRLKILNHEAYFVFFVIAESRLLVSLNQSVSQGEGKGYITQLGISWVQLRV